MSVYGAVGRQALALRLGLTVRSVDVAVQKQVFPAAWFPVIADMLLEQGKECPVSCFAFKESDTLGHRLVVSRAPQRSAA